MTAEPDVDGCPLCRGRDASRIREIPFDRIWASYSRDWGVDLARDLRAAHEPAPTTSLVRCSTCGLRYFTPARAGDPSFYAAVAAGMPVYAPDRWEFAVVHDSLRSTDDVVDLGCADGRFLALVRSSVASVTGVDHNPAAIEDVRARGIEGHVTNFEAFAEAREASFDVVCAFQTLEHVPDVRALLEPAMRLVRPGGRIFVSVPNASRLGHEVADALDHPPHHLSRWTAPDLATLAERSGLRLRRVLLEPPDLSHARLARRNRVLARTPFGRSGRLAQRAAGGVARILEPRGAHVRRIRRGTYARRGWFGHSIVAEFGTREV